VSQTAGISQTKNIRQFFRLIRANAEAMPVIELDLHSAQA
jgi:hypothetical protein